MTEAFGKEPPLAQPPLRSRDTGLMIEKHPVVLRKTMRILLTILLPLN